MANARVALRHSFIYHIHSHRITKVIVSHSFFAVVVVDVRRFGIYVSPLISIWSMFGAALLLMMFSLLLFFFGFSHLVLWCVAHHCTYKCAD